MTTLITKTLPELCRQHNGPLKGVRVYEVSSKDGAFYVRREVAGPGCTRRVRGIASHGEEVVGRGVRGAEQRDVTG